MHKLLKLIHNCDIPEFYWAETGKSFLSSNLAFFKKISLYLLCYTTAYCISHKKHFQTVEVVRGSFLTLIYLRTITSIKTYDSYIGTTCATFDLLPLYSYQFSTICGKTCVYIIFYLKLNINSKYVMAFKTTQSIVLYDLLNLMKY